MKTPTLEAIVVVAGRGLSAAITVVFALFVPALLGPDDYGLFAFWMAQLLLLIMLLDAGTSELLRRFGPLAVRDGAAPVRQLLARVLAVKLWVVPLAIAFVLWHGVTTDSAMLLGAGVAATVSWMAADLQFAARRMVRYSLYNILRKLIRLAVLVPCYELAGRAGLVFSLLAAELIVLGLFAYWAIGFVRGGAGATPPLAVAMTRSAVAMFVAGLCYMALGRLPVLLAENAGFSLTQIAYIALAVDIAYFTLRELFYGISESMQPAQVRDADAGRGDAVVASARRAVIISAALTLPATSLLVLHAQALLGLLGDDYRAGAPLLVLVAPVTVLNVLLYVYRQLLVVNDKFVLVAAVHGLTVMVFLGVALVRGLDSSAALIEAVLWALVGGLVAMRILAATVAPGLGEWRALCALAPAVVAVHLALDHASQGSSLYAFTVSAGVLCAFAVLVRGIARSRFG